MKSINYLLLTFVFAVVSVSAVSAQYYDPYQYNYQYNNGYSNQSYGVSYYGSNNYNYNYNNGYSYDQYYNGGCNNGYYTNCLVSYYTLSPQTNSATNVAPNSATINGYVSVSGNGYYNNTYGTASFQYGTNYSNLNYSTNPVNIYNNTGINANLTGLACGTTYYFRAITSSQNGVQYGSTNSFTTPGCYNYYYNGYNNYNNNYCPYNNCYSSYQRIPKRVITNCNYGYVR